LPVRGTLPQERGSYGLAENPPSEDSLPKIRCLIDALLKTELEEKKGREKIQLYFFLSKFDKSP
jgi:hypothetical protein